MDSVLIPALRELREDIQATNKSVKELREELEAIATAAKQTRDRVDSVQAAAREDRRKVTDLRNQLERLTEKMTDMEDRSRRNNVRLVGLPEGAEGSNAAGFLRVNLSKWIPSLKGHDIEIDQAHRVYDGGRGSDRPHTLIFRVLRWHDRSEILKGTRQAYLMKCAQDNVTLLFFPDFSPATTIRRKAFNPVLKKMTVLGLQPFLIYPAVINPLGSEVILGPLRCFNMPWYLCLFQLLITYYWPTCIFFCIQHKLCYNNMWPRWMYMFAFFRKKILCVVSKFWENFFSWNKAIKPTLNSPE